MSQCSYYVQKRQKRYTEALEGLLSSGRYIQQHAEEILADADHLTGIDIQIRIRTDRFPEMEVRRTISPLTLETE